MAGATKIVGAAALGHMGGGKKGGKGKAKGMVKKAATKSAVCK